MEKVLLIDRDGTLIEEPTDFQVDALEKIRLCADVIPSLLALKKAGFRMVMITNQDGLGTERFPQPAFQQAQDFILALFTSQGIEFSDVFICPHWESEHCNCRKPKTGLLDAFLQMNRIDYTDSWVIGDRDSDKRLAHNLGLFFLPVARDHGWKAVAETILHHQRSASLVRTTRETDIHLALRLDSEGENDIRTPIGFFSHMLDQTAKHGGFHLRLEAKGDLEVDEHHLIEDTAIVLGESLKQALGNKKGIARYGFTVPMDESLASVAIDLSGRGYCVFKGEFTREFVGGMAVEMVPHFFNTLANSLGATLHMSVSGDNHHHMIEACFKALGRALRQAVKSGGEATIPSTKGIL